MQFEDRVQFENRETAARELASALAEYAGTTPLVLAVPRGAVPMARIVAEALDGDLDVVLVHKIGAPFQPEYAIGAVDEAGHVELRERGFDPEYVQREAARQIAALQRRRASYGIECPAVDPAGRTVIVIDDGVATGATLLAALRAVQARDPAHLVAAVAVAPADTVERLRAEADDVVVLQMPTPFVAVGMHFRDFGQVSDDEVVAHLRGHRRQREAAEQR